MAERTSKFDEVVAAAVEAIPEAREEAAKLYSRIRVGKTTLAYIWVSGTDATRIDLYVSPESLPKRVTIFAPGRGRARKEGLIATLTEKSGKRETNQVIEGLKTAAQMNVKATESAPAEEPTPAPTPEDETDADLAKAAAAADANPSSARAKRKGGVKVEASA